MSSLTFAQQLSEYEFVNPEGNVEQSLLEQYEQVVVSSIKATFGLNSLLAPYGGDVDTLHNVRLIDIDKRLHYKSEDHRIRYDGRDDYDSRTYHGDKFFAETKAKKRNDYYIDSKTVKDAYTGKDLGFGNGLSAQQKAELDHVIACKEIHNDRARVLSGLDGVELANQSSNYAWTNKSINASMGAKTIEEYIADCKAKGKDIDQATIHRMQARDKKARDAYNAQLAHAYYCSSDFFSSTAMAAGKEGVKAGAKQALGLVMIEIWFSAKEKLQYGYCDLSDLFHQLSDSVKEGVSKAKDKYKLICGEMFSSTLSGILSSLTTTLCNCFFTTAKNTITIIRQTWASIVESVKVIFFNPAGLPLGDRLLHAAKIIATAASAIVGAWVGNIINTSLASLNSLSFLGIDPGDVIATLGGTLVTGILSCSLIYLLDHCAAIKSIVSVINRIEEMLDPAATYRKQGALLEQYCAKLMSIDVDQLRAEVAAYQNATAALSAATSEQELERALDQMYQDLNIPSPYGKHKDIDSFMADEDAVLSFS